MQCAMCIQQAGDATRLREDGEVDRLGIYEAGPTWPARVTWLGPRGYEVEHGRVLEVAP